MTWAWISMPITISQGPVAPWIRLSGLLGTFIARCSPPTIWRAPPSTAPPPPAPAPTANSVSSSNGRPMTCRPSGSPSADKPAGTAMPGRPAMLTVTVNTSLRYISIGSAETFSPMPKAADGVAGVRIASTPSANTVSKSRLMSVRIFCARR